MRLLQLHAFAALAPAALAMLLAVGTAMSTFGQESDDMPGYRARFERALQANELEPFLRELQSEAANHSRDDVEFAQAYVDASDTWFQAVMDSGKSIEERRAGFQVALDAIEAFGTQTRVSAIVDLWAGELLRIKSFDEAETLLRRVIDRAGVPVNSLPFLLQRYAQAARGRSDLREAVSRIDRAQVAIEQMNAPAPWPSIARCAVGVTRADIEFNVGRIDAAFARMRALREEPGLTAEPALGVQAALTHGKWALAIEDFALLREIVSDELVERARAHDPSLVPDALYLRATARYKDARNHGGELDGSRELLNETVASSLGAPEIECAARLHLVDIALRTGDMSEAVEQLARAEQLGPRESDARARVAALRAETALRLRASRSELEAHAHGLSQELDALRQQFLSLPLQKSGVGFLLGGAPRMLFATWVRVQIALDPTERGLVKALAPIVEAQALGTLSRSLDARATLDLVRSTLVAPGVGVLIYLPAPDHSHVFAVDSQGILHDELEGNFTLRGYATALEREWNAAPSGDARSLELRRKSIDRAGRVAADKFLPSRLRERMTSWELCLISGAELCFDPSFECFVLDDGSFLGLTQGIGYLPSLPVAVRLSERAPSREHASGVEAVLVAAVGIQLDVLSASSGLAPILADEHELKRVMAAFAPSRVEMRLRSAATLTALRESAVSDATVLAILAHGAYDITQCGDDERPAFLVLAPDGQQETGVACCADIESLKLPPLVELLACSTARGPTRMGDGAAAHLVGACFLGGARCVLASRTQVELQATVALAAEFHSALRTAGLTPAAALLVARRNIAAMPQRSDPWYWAGLALHGDASGALFAAAEPSSAVARETNSVKWSALAAATAVASAFAFVVYRRIRRARVAS